MPAPRIQRQIDRLLDEAEQAVVGHDWAKVQAIAREVLSLDPENEDARSFLAAARREPDSVERASPLPAGPAGEGEGEGAPVGAGLKPARPEPPDRAGETPAPPESQRTDALDHLDLAIAEFREMKMQPSLERALRHKELLRA